MNKKAFLLTNIMLLKWVGGVGLHFVLSFLLAKHALTPQGSIDGQSFIGASVFIVPGFYLVVILVCLLVLWGVVEPIQNYYMKKCQENSE